MSLKNRAIYGSDLDSIDGPVDSDPGLRASRVQARAPRRISASPPAIEEAVELPLISIGAPADPALLEPTYAYLAAYCFACFPPPVAQRLNVAIYELYANALRYGTDRGEVRIELRRAAGVVELAVINYADLEHLERLQQQLSRVREDASAAFSGEMSRFDGSERSPMLGIVRIVHEVALPLELRRGRERVEISTRCEL